MLRLPPFTYLAPKTVADAARLLAEHGPEAMIVAGGTDLYPNMKRRQFEPTVLVGLGAIRELRGIAGTPRTGIRLGSMTTLTSVSRHDDVASHYPALATASGILGVYLSERNEAFVDLDSTVRTKHPGGSMNELFTVFTIVNAVATNLPDVQEVQLLIDGHEVDTLAGHVDLRRPLRKNESLNAPK